MINGPEEWLLAYDLTDESCRSYYYPCNGELVGYDIQNPTRLMVAECGTHVVVDAEGAVHHVKPGWLVQAVEKHEQGGE